MTITVEATYENGVLKPVEPLPLQEHEKVEVVVRTPAAVRAAVEAVRRTAGMIPWAGDIATLERMATDPEISIEESP